MNSFNHVLIGTVVYEYIKEKYGIELDRESFLKGNTCPDHSIAFLRPHRLFFCSRAVRKKTIRLCRGNWGLVRRKASKKIGILCHYYSDFFCRAHNPHFGGNLKDHIRYEDELLCFMEQNMEFYRGIDYIPEVSVPHGAGEINRLMRLRIQERPSEQGDYASELFCAIRACAELVLSVSLAILVLTEGETEKILPVSA